MHQPGASSETKQRQNAHCGQAITLPKQQDDEAAQQHHADTQRQEGNQPQEQAVKETPLLKFKLRAQQFQSHLRDFKGRAQQTAHRGEQTAALSRVAHAVGRKAAASATTDQQADDQPDSRRDTDGFPGVVMHKIVSSVARCLGFGNGCLL